MTVRPAALVTLDCLGTAVAVPAELAALCRHLPRTTRAPQLTLPDTGPDGVATLTALTVGATDLLTVHAAVVATADGALVVPAASGAGKSTLTAALVARGFDYLSDEVLAVDRATGVVTAFARPIAVHAGSWDVVALPAPRPTPGGERFVDPAALGHVSDRPTQVAHVVLPRRGDHRLALTDASPGEVLAGLVPRCFNHYKDSVGTLVALRTIATTAAGFVAEYSDATGLADALATRVGLHEDPPRRGDRSEPPDGA